MSSGGRGAADGASPADVFPVGAHSRRRTAGNGYIGRLDRAAGFALRAGLASPGDVELGTALSLVTTSLYEQASAGNISVRTRRSYARVAAEVVMFAGQQGAVRLADVDEDLAADYVWSANAPGTRRPGLLPMVDTLQARRSGMRAMFATARLLGLDDRDPAAHLQLPSRDAERAAVHEDAPGRGPEGRPLTRREAARCRTAARYRHDDSRLPAAAALLLAGAGTGEAHGVLVRHLRAPESLVWCPGAGRSHGRWLRLDAWSAEALEDHVLYLSRRVPPEQLPDTPVVHVGPTRTRRQPGGGADPAHVRQSETVGLARRLLRKAGLGGVPGVRPSSLPEHAALLAFEQTGRLEAAAVVLGVARLDAVAALLGYDWREEHRLAPPYDGGRA